MNVGKQQDLHRAGNFGELSAQSDILRDAAAGVIR
jgi:hypothetical protein